MLMIETTVASPLVFTPHTFSGKDLDGGGRPYWHDDSGESTTGSLDKAEYESRSISSTPPDFRRRRTRGAWGSPADNLDAEEAR
jgi:hypothetical protein